MDTAWALDQLGKYVSLTESHNGSSANFATYRSYSNSPRPTVLAQQAIVERILAQVYPLWREEIPVRKNYEFGHIRDAAIQARALLEREDELKEHLEPPAPSLSADALHPWIWEPARALWRDGHFRAAVQAASTGLDARLQDRVSRRDVTGTPLVQSSFSADPPEAGKPRLRVPEQLNEQSTRSLQNGARALGEASFLVVRNLRSHDIDDLSEHEALEQLSVLSLFSRIVESCSLEV